MTRNRAWQGVLAALLIAASLPASAQVLATSDVILDTTAALTAETAFGALTADAVRAAAKADVALVNGSVFRPKTVAAGKLEAPAVEELFVDPGETVAVLTLTGEKLRAALERGVGLLPLPNKGFLQVSGMTVVFDSTKPRDRRIQSIEIGRAPLQADRTYTVALSGALAKGGLGYFLVFNGAPYRPIPTTVLNAVRDHLKAQPRVGAGLTGRLRDAGRRSDD